MNSIQTVLIFGAVIASIGLVYGLWLMWVNRETHHVVKNSHAIARTNHGREVLKHMAAYMPVTDVA